MSTRLMTLVLGTAAGAFLAAGLTSLATSPVANATCVTDILGMQICGFDDFVTTLGQYSDVAAADPADDWNAMVLQGPGFTDVLTSGNDPSDGLATLPGLSDISSSVLEGMSGMTVNTFIDPSDPALDSAFSFTLPFTDPLVGVWDFFLPLGF
jgi:hypothetical protein